jgi:hypothetical protein
VLRFSSCAVAAEAGPGCAPWEVPVQIRELFAKGDLAKWVMSPEGGGGGSYSCLILAAITKWQS